MTQLTRSPALSPPRKRGSTTVQKEMDSRFRGNDQGGVTFARGD